MNNLSAASVTLAFAAIVGRDEAGRGWSGGVRQQA